MCCVSTVSFSLVRVLTFFLHFLCKWLLCKSERSVLALKIGPFRWVKYSPIFEYNLAPLNQGQYSPIS